MEAGHLYRWKPRVVMTPTLSPLVTRPHVVALTHNDDKVGIMTVFCFKCRSSAGKTQLYFFWHDDVIKWKRFPHYWCFVRGIHRWPVDSLHKGHWRGALIRAWTRQTIETPVIWDAIALTVMEKFIWSLMILIMFSHIRGPFTNTD